MSISYFIGIDHDDDGSFSETGDTLTSDVLHAEWHLGMRTQYDSVAAIGEATIIVRNPNRSYSPDVTGGWIGKPFIIQSDDGNTIRRHFTGFVQSIQVQAGNQGEQHATIIATTRDSDLRQYDVRLPLQVNITADAAIHTVLDQIQWRYAVLKNRCIIGRDSIGSSWIFPDDAISRNFETGLSVFGFVGDDWDAGLRAHQAIAQFTDGESGRFFFNREGVATFVNRHHLLINTAIAASFADNMVALDYEYGDIVNQLEITLTPRTVGADNSLLWSLTKPLKITAGERIELIARYGANDEPFGAVTVIPPKRYLHYRAYTNDEILSNEQSDQIDIRLLDTGISASSLEIRNRSTVDLYVTMLDLRGTPLITGREFTVQSQDDSSISRYGKHNRQMRLPVISDVDDARGILVWALQRRSRPRGIVRTISTDHRHHPIATLALTLMDLIQIQETQSGHDETYAIIAEQHRVDRGGTRHRVSWLVEPAESGYFFIIGTHSIGDSDVILALR